MSKLYGTRRSLAALAIFVFASGCTPSTPPLDTKVEIPTDFGENGHLRAPSHWWTTFGDAGLDSLVTRALRGNLDVRIAEARRREAAAFVDLEQSAYWPDLRANAGVTGITGEGFVNAPEASLGLNSDLELDLFGEIGASVEAERLRTAARIAGLRAAELTVAADVASTWVRLVEARRQFDLLAEQVETNETVLGLLEGRFGSGQIRGVDILRQEQLVEATHERAAEAEGRVATLENALAVLLGRAPRATFQAPDGPLPDLPALPATGVPADLVERRPDVQRDWLLLQAADRDLAAAIARKYPRLSLSASTRTDAEDPANLFQDWIATLAGNLAAPLFTGGRLQADVDRNEAIRSRLLDEYTRTVLTAFREVEDALVLERTQTARIDRIARQVELSRQSTEQLRSQYLNGLGDYLDVLTALTEQQQLQRNLITARRERLETRVALYRALAGPLDALPHGQS